MAVNLNSHNHHNINTLVISGAGYSIIHEIAIAAELQKRCNFKHFIGTSAGAIVSLALALGWQLDELIVEMEARVLGQHVYSGNLLLSILKLAYNGYIFESDIRHIILDVILSKAVSDSQQVITFSSPVFADRSLTIVANEATTGQPVIFSATNSPTVDVRLAALASSSIPVLFKPPQLAKTAIISLSDAVNIPDIMTLIDGSVTNFYPVKYATDLNTTIGIYHQPFVPTASTAIVPLIRAAVDTFNVYFRLTFRYDIFSDEVRDRTLVFTYPISIVDYLSILTRPQIDSMLSSARQWATDFIASHPSLFRQ